MSILFHPPCRTRTPATVPHAHTHTFFRYSLLIADTVIVTSEGNTVLTEASDKSFRQVSYTFDDDGDAGEAKTAKVEPKADGPIGPRKARVAAEVGTTEKSEWMGTHWALSGA